MSFDSGSLHAALAAAVGDDAGLIDDLRLAFLESAERQIDLLSRARCDANWALAAWRLKGLCASFGVNSMIVLAEEAEQGAPGDPRILRQLRASLDSLSL
ncbi:Hpt domain-containing protein [Sphingobium subterraneum]|nr:Hpt domain-containing protein [Sphingobium subterraneum]